MSDILRWHLDGLPGTTGIVEVMLYADHLAAVAAAEHEDKCNRQRARREGFAAGVKAAREAVEALSFDPLNRDQGPNETKRQALAAIDGVKGEQ